MADALKASENDDKTAGEKTSNDNGIFAKLSQKAAEKKPVSMELGEWLESCKTDPMAYANFADRLIKAIGEPEIVDTRKSSNQERLVFGSKKIARYDAFSEMYDSEHTVDAVVKYIRGRANGLLVLRGPVGSGKTEIATILERLAEKEPMYLLKCKKTGQISPFNDTPLCIVSDNAISDDVSKNYGIPKGYLNEVKSAWVTKRLEHHEGNPEAAFEVVKVYPSRDKQIGIAKLDPKDNQSPDINALIGSTDINLVGDEDPLDDRLTMSAGDPDAYIPGAFSKSNGGVFHGAEFFRNNPAMLNTFLEPVTTGFFTGDGGVGMLPMNQLIVITTNDPVWQELLKKNDSDALHNRAHVVDVPYTLRMSEEMKIYDKLMAKNGLDNKPMAPGTLELLAEFAVVTRLKGGENGALEVYDPYVRAQVLNGEIPDGADKKIPKIRQLRDKASADEGLDGFSIRDAERNLVQMFNARANEGIFEADTILAVETLRDFIDNADDKTIPSAMKPYYEAQIDEVASRNKEKIEKTINAALIDADEGLCQTQFDKYVEYARAFVDEETITDSGEELPMGKIIARLSAMEKMAGVHQPAEFRRTVVEGVNKELARVARLNAGKEPEDQLPVIVKWDTYEPLAKVIRAQHEADLGTKRHIVKAESDSELKTDEEKRQHNRFFENMSEQGYSQTMVKRMLLEIT